MRWGLDLAIYSLLQCLAGACDRISPWKGLYVNQCLELAVFFFTTYAKCAREHFCFIACLGPLNIPTRVPALIYYTFPSCPRTQAYFYLIDRNPARMTHGCQGLFSKVQSLGIKHKSTELFLQGILLKCKIPMRRPELGLLYHLLAQRPCANQIIFIELCVCVCVQYN